MTVEQHRAKQRQQHQQEQATRSRPDHPSDCCRCHPGDRPHNYLPMERA